MTLYTLVKACVIVTGTEVPERKDKRLPSIDQKERIVEVLEKKMKYYPQ